MVALLQLLLLFLLVRFFFFREEQRVRRSFYSQPELKACDRALLRCYRFQNPFRISRQFLQKKGEKEVHLYGETPLTLYEKIGIECQLTSADSVLELGCGRGRGLFFLMNRFGVSARGVDWIPVFIEKAQQVKERFSCARISFSCENFLQTDLQGHSLIYLFGTALDEYLIDRLVQQFKKLPPTVKIVTVSYPLTDYSSAFAVEKEFSGKFPWGTAQFYVQSVRSRG